MSSSEIKNDPNKDSSNTLQFLISLLDQGQMRSNPPKYSNDIFKSLKLLDVKSTVHSISPPSLSDWLKIRNDMKPVVIKNLISDWPALQKWDLNYFWMVMAQRTVPIEIGKRYTDSDWGQKLLKFEEFLSKLTDQNEEKVYLAQHPLLEQIPQLENDIIVPGKFNTPSEGVPQRWRLHPTLEIHTTFRLLLYW